MHGMMVNNVKNEIIGTASAANDEVKPFGLHRIMVELGYASRLIPFI